MQTFRRWASSCLLVTVSVYQGFLPAAQAQEASAGTPIAESNNRSATTLSDLTVGAGETRIVDFTSSGVLDISGDLTNQGTLLFISSNNQVSTVVVNASNIFNGGSIGTPVSNLVLAAVNSIVNQGSITSSGSLTVVAPSITNALPAGVSGPAPVMQAVNNLQVLTGNLMNNGVLASVLGNITVANPSLFTTTVAQTLGAGTLASLVGSNTLPAAININNAGGVIRAMNGVVSVGGARLGQESILSMIGGTVEARALHIDGGHGAVEAFLETVAAPVSISAGAAHFGTSSTMLTLSISIAGDPTFFNDAGSITINGNIDVDEALSIVASRDILFAGAFTLSSADPVSGHGNEINLIAGADVSAFGGTSSSSIPIGGTPLAAGQFLIVDGPSSTGGNIVGADGIIDARATGANGNGGEVNIIAFANGPSSGGIRNLHVLTGGTGSGSNGNLNIVAGGSVDGVNAVIMDNIDTTGGAGMSGSVAVFAAQPLGVMVFGANGVGSGGFFPGASTAFAITLNNNVRSGGGAIVVDTDGDLSLGQVTASATAAGRGAGDVTLNASTITANTIAANGAAGAVGGGLFGPMGGSGGLGGDILVNATNAILGTVSARGGDGGRGSDGTNGAAGMMGAAGGSGGAGGAGGSFTANVISGLNVSTTLDLDGGSGGAGGNGGSGGGGIVVGGGGGAGGMGGYGAGAGRVFLNSAGGNLSFDLLSTASIEGGSGGAGGAGGSGAAGTTLGGSGGMSGAGGSGAFGGYLSMNTSGSGQIFVDQVDLSGGSGGAGNQSGAGGAGAFAGSGGMVSMAGSGGMGGLAFLRTAAGSLTVNSNLDVSGGAGADQALAGGAGGTGTSLGGIGGAVMDAGSGAMGGLIFLSSTSGSLTVGNLTSVGGAGGQQAATGGAGGAGDFAGAGGRVGNGGLAGGGGYIDLYTRGAVDINGLVSSDGGATASYSGRGGTGGASAGSGFGGAGGDVGGSGVVSGTGGLVFVHGSTINLNGPIATGISSRGGAIGDHNGVAGAGGSAGLNGMGGAGGDVGGLAFAGNGGLVYLTAPSGINNVWASVNVTGGSALAHNGQAGVGGDGGLTGGSGGAGGDVGMAAWGGSGGLIFADTDGGTLNAGNMWADGGPGSLHSGRAGAGGAATGANSIGGRGGNIASAGFGGRGGLINLTSDSGDIVSSFAISSFGGGGGDQAGVAGAGGVGVAGGGSGGSVGDAGLAMSGGQVFAFSLSGELNFNFVSSGGGVGGLQTGTGGAGGSGAMGGSGGNVGLAGACGPGGLIFLNSVSGDVFLNGFVDASAGFVQGSSGIAGDGGAGLTGSGGNGGTVGAIASSAAAGFIYIDGNSVTLRRGSIIWCSGGAVFEQGGAAGAGGDAGTNGMGGMGGALGMTGNGGNGGTVIISGDNGVTLNANFIDVTGGSVYDPLGQSGAGGRGGSGGLLSGAGGSGGSVSTTASGGAGGTLIVRSLSGTLDVSSPIFAQGGSAVNDALTAGAGGAALSPAGRGGAGGSASPAGMGGRGGTVLLSAFGGTLTLNEQITADGGSGGVQQAVGGAGGAGGSTGGAGGSVGSSGNGGAGGFVFGFAPNRNIIVNPTVNAGLAGQQQGTAGAGGIGGMMNGSAGVVSPAGSNGVAGQTIIVGTNPDEDDRLNAVAFTSTLASLAAARKPMLEVSALVKENGEHVLLDGEALFAPAAGECSVRTGLGTVRIAQGCIAFVVARGSETAVFSLHDSNSKKVSVTTGVAHVDLALGSALVLTNRTDKTLSQINPTPGLTFRNVREQKLSNGLKAIVGDFSILSALLNTSCLQDLRKSSCKDDRRSIERLIKNACILSYLTASRGVYRQQ